ncbi:interferon alpha-inducible protein 27-like protein 2A [Anolis sagrei]|uniref:interferon alpha-inducible protein 27-like protein 2A n=1 Tax=Anolis sagrei TaxID=38937 RepID=UPI0035229E69
MAGSPKKEAEMPPKASGNPGAFKRLTNSGKGAMIGAGLGIGLTVVGLPLVLGAAGFTSAGIAAGSIAAKMMSASAIASGGGVAAGSSVAVLQSIGAAGLALSTKLGVTAATASAGAAIGAAKKPSPQKP